MAAPEPVPVSLRSGPGRVGRSPGAFTVLGVAALGALMVFARRPDAFTHPQLWAEDGRYWYAEAHNLGVSATLFRVHTGYLQTFSRLVADGALPFPLHLVPHWFSLWALLAQLAPALVIVSNRFAVLVPSRAARVALAVLYFAVPASAEVNMNVTNGQWHLALLAFVLLLAAPPVSLAGSIFDVVVLVLAGLSGPFAIFLTPIAAIIWWLRRDRASMVRLVIIAGCAVTQGVLSLAFAAQRSPEPLGAGPSLLLRILGNHLALIPLFGTRLVRWLELHSPFWAAALALLAGVGILVLVGYAAWRGPLGLRLLWLFTGLLVAAELAVPQASTTRPQWEKLALTGTERYFVIPTLATLVTLTWFVLSPRPLPLRAVGGLGLVAALVCGVSIDWRYPRYIDYPLARFEQVLDNTAPGQSVVIPINPPGWTMRLIKE